MAEARRKEADSKRKERLAFVTMSLSNMMPDKPRKARGDRDKAAKFNRAAAGSEESEDESEYSGSESEESEEDAPIRRRAARNVTYNMKEYDDMMKSAIDDGKVKYSAEEMQVGQTCSPFRAFLEQYEFYRKINFGHLNFQCFPFMNNYHQSFYSLHSILVSDNNQSRSI